MTQTEEERRKAAEERLTWTDASQIVILSPREVEELKERKKNTSDQKMPRGTNNEED